MINIPDLSSSFPFWSTPFHPGEDYGCLVGEAPTGEDRCKYFSELTDRFCWKYRIYPGFPWFDSCGQGCGEYGNEELSTSEWANVYNQKYFINSFVDMYDAIVDAGVPDGSLESVVGLPRGVPPIKLRSKEFGKMASALGYVLFPIGYETFALLYDSKRYDLASFASVYAMCKIDAYGLDRTAMSWLHIQA